MREIKFRAWDGVRMIYQGSDGYFNNVKHPKYPALQTMQLHGVMQVCEVMQFTGLLDKNGKEIYEGDVVKWDDRSGGKYWRFAVVKINPDIQFDCDGVKGLDGFVNSGGSHCFHFGSFIYTDTHNHLTVIGNQYENSDLLDK